MAAPTPTMAPAPSPDPLMGNPVGKEWYQAHGYLMWAGFGLLMPIGLIVSRHFQSVGAWWFHAHWITQSLAVACVVPGFAIAVDKFEVLTDSVHARLGIAIFVLTCLQPIMGLFRPHKGSTLRLVWYFAHWLIGTTVVILAWYDIFKGMDLYEEDWGVSIQNLKTWFAVSISVLAFVYLLLGRWDHLMGQRDTATLTDGAPRFASMRHVTSMIGMRNGNGTSAERAAAAKKLAEDREDARNEGMAV